MTGQRSQPAYFIDEAGSKSRDAATLILDTTRPFRETPDASLDVLDVGCGFGNTAIALARLCRSVTAIEPSPGLFARAQEVVKQSELSNIAVTQRSIEQLSERDAFDVVVLDNVLEHLPEQEKALATIATALRRAGLLYVLVPNRWWPMEAHYQLPFLSWLPLPLANRYVRLMRKADDYTDASYAPGYGRLVRLLKSAGFDPHFVVPANLNLTVEGAALHYRVGSAMLRRAPWLWRFAKGFLVVAVKR
jgi:2-polyprenyl-3-methyl-5-hydroxy-6-metoxy-1,4-benzoquinol methylase